MSNTITREQVEERKTQWITSVQTAQQRGQELSQELTRINEQLAQLNGAIQACDVFLQGVTPSVIPPTVATSPE